jgi:hypothetical protein
MSYQVDELIQLALKNQSIAGTAEESFDESDIVEIESGSTFTHSPHVRNIRLVNGGFGWKKSIVGPREVGLTASLPFRTGGEEDNPGDVAVFLEASGFKKEGDDNGVYTFKPTASPSQFTAWMLSGNPGTGSCIAHIARDVKGACKISLDFNEAIALLSFDGKGILSDIPDTDTHKTITTATTTPTPSLVGATINLFNDTNLIPVNIEFDIKATVTVTLDPTNDSGCGITLLTNREIDYTMKVYKRTSIDPYSTLYSANHGTISVEWDKFKVETKKAEITGIDTSDQDGVTCLDISGKILDDDLTITIDTSDGSTGGGGNGSTGGGGNGTEG